MTATSAPQGLVPVYHRNGGVIRAIPLVNGIASGYGTSIFTGDPIVMATDGTMTISGATNASIVDGVFAGVQYTTAAGNRVNNPYWPASTVATNIIAFFTSDPNIEYEIQANGSLLQTSIGDGAPIVLGTGNTRSGQSTSALSTTLVGAAAQCQFKIVDLGGVVGNAWGDTYTIVRVIIGNVSAAFAPGNTI